MSHNINVMTLVQRVKGGDVTAAVDMLHTVSAANNSPTEALLMVAQLAEMLEGGELRKVISALASYNRRLERPGLLHMMELPAAAIA